MSELFIGVVAMRAENKFVLAISMLYVSHNSHFAKVESKAICKACKFALLGVVAKLFAAVCKAGIELFKPL